MAPSLRERLLGRSPNGAAPPAAPAEGNGTAVTTGEPSQLAPVDPPPPRQPVTTALAGAQHAANEAARIDARSARVEQERLSAVDQLKLELHRKLVERLDLAALERITDEALLKSQIRNAVIEFIRTEQAPLSATEREEIVEQII
jgi:pilus assembly protein CpaF